MHVPANSKYQVVNFAELPGVECLCGIAKRAFEDVPDYPATVHLTEISADAKRHYHVRLTEVYFILESEAGAQLELDGELLAVAAGTCVMIPPGVRHRALGRMKVLIFVTPKFDAADEWFN